MRFKAVVMIVLCLALFSPAYADEKPAESLPIVVLPEDTYTFHDAFEGSEVVHDFIVQNRGTAVLEISSVKPGCGCTLASYDKQIPPGGDGKITLKLNTDGYGGTTITKGALVETNDKARLKFSLNMKGNVQAFASIEPRRANLSGAIDQAIRSKITIIPDERYAFKVLESKAEKGQDIRFKLEEVRESGKLQYVLNIENTKKTPGRYVDNIILKTDSSLRPEIQISVYGNLFEPVKKKS
jgi:hypothetical protein